MKGSPRNNKMFVAHNHIKTIVRKEQIHYKDFLKVIKNFKCIIVYGEVGASYHQSYRFI